ncbi:MAG TPA: carotenoid oxygenase family protein [Polyangiaceae bacterium LLY-WYZ-15_(1-7)]|nr:carotenoid oxygenase family protein [Polyangiaceae bacterium LLY-WYZ-15_(1-7)]
MGLSLPGLPRRRLAPPGAASPACLAAFDDLPREHGFEPLEVEGALPDALSGTFYATGPALSGLFGERYPHWFDGDGAVSAVRFAGGRAEGAVRLVQSAGLRDERRHGGLRYAGFARAFDWPLHLRPVFSRAKNTANTAMLAHAGRLFALWEGGRPTEIDPDTLETLGTRDLGGAVRLAYAAHPHAVPSLDTVFGFGVRVATGRGPKPLLDLFATDAAGRTRRLGVVPLPFLPMVHDFIATERHLVFFVSPLRVRLGRLLFGFGGYAENLVWEPARGTEILVVPLDDPERVVRWRTEAFYQWHFVNAWERGADIVVDLVRYDDFRVGEWLQRLWQGRPLPEAPGRLTRAILTPASTRCQLEERAALPVELPRIAPAARTRPHRVVWSTAHADVGAMRRGPQDRVARLDAETGAATHRSLGGGVYPGEALFVPRPGASREDDGWLLLFATDVRERRGSCFVLDARSLETVARCRFRDHLPPRLHGAFRPR